MGNLVLDYAFRKGKYSPIAIGQCQQVDLDDEHTILTVRDANPILFVKEWCDRNHYEWMSLPEAVDDFGLEKILELAPEEYEKFSQFDESNGYHPESLSLKMLFNSYVLSNFTKGENEDFPQQAKFYFGNKIPLSHDEIKHGVEDIGLYIINYPERIIPHSKDISKYFQVCGLDSVGWFRHNLENREFAEMIFSSFSEAAIKMKEKYNIEGFVDCPIPKLNSRLGVASLSKRLNVNFHHFYNTSNYIVDKFIVKKIN